MGFAMWKELTENVSLIREKTVRNAELFTKIYDQQLHKSILGDEEADWKALLAQVEVFYTRSEVARWMLLWKTLHDGFGFALADITDIPVVRLEKIAKYCHTKEEAARYVEFARTATRSDFDDEILTLRGKPTKETCAHLDGFRRLEECVRCGVKHNL